MNLELEGFTRGQKLHKKSSDGQEIEIIALKNKDKNFFDSSFL
jgi:hypothetical protein